MSRYEYNKEYSRKFYKCSSGFRGGRQSGLMTAGTEMLVCADLCRQGFEVTRPVNPNAKHDLHVKLPSVGWTGVQVKAARYNSKTDKVVLSNTAGRESPILALVFLPTFRIEYRAGTEKLPKELK